MCRKKSLFALFSLIVTFSFSACYYDNEEELYGDTSNECEVTAVRYSVEVSSILQKNCYACHSTGSNLGNLLLDSYSTARSSAISGTLLGTVNHRPGFSPMPQDAPKLSDCDIQALQTWVDDGTPNN